VLLLNEVEALIAESYLPDSSILPHHTQTHTQVRIFLYIKGHRQQWLAITPHGIQWLTFVCEHHMELLPLLLACFLLFTVAAPARDIADACASQVNGTYRNPSQFESCWQLFCHVLLCNQARVIVQ
jgi:hypothetical protein